MGYSLIWANKPFRWVLFAQILSNVGDMFTSVALPLLIYARTGSVESMAFMMVTFWLPNLVFAPILGVLVDRINRKYLLIGMDLIRAIFVACIPFAEMHLLYVLCFLIALCGNAFDLSKQGITVQLVPKEQLVEANSTVQGINNFISLGGPLLGGAVVAVLGLTLPFYLDVISFVLSAFLLSIAAIPNSLEKHKSAENVLTKFRNDFKEGFSYVITNPPLLFSMTLFMFVMMFAMPLNVLFIPVFSGALHATSWQIGLAYSLFGAGTLSGTLVSPRLNKKFNRVSLILLGLFCMGAFSVGTSLTHNLWLALGCYTMGAFFNGFVNPLNASLRQENIPNHLMGRVNGMYFSAVNVLSIAAMLMTGLIGHLVAARTLYFYSSLGYALIGVLGMLSPWYKATRRGYAVRLERR